MRNESLSYLLVFLLTNLTACDFNKIPETDFSKKTKDIIKSLELSCGDSLMKIEKIKIQKQTGLKFLYNKNEVLELEKIMLSLPDDSPSIIEKVISDYDKISQPQVADWGVVMDAKLNKCSITLKTGFDLYVNTLKHYDLIKEKSIILKLALQKYLHNAVATRDLMGLFVVSTHLKKFSKTICPDQSDIEKMIDDFHAKAKKINDKNWSALDVKPGIFDRIMKFFNEDHISTTESNAMISYVAEQHKHFGSVFPELKILTSKCEI